MQTKITIEAVVGLAPGMILGELVDLHTETKGGIVLVTKAPPTDAPGGMAAGGPPPVMDTAILVRMHRRRLVPDLDKGERENEWKKGDYLLVGGMAINVIVGGEHLVLMQDHNVLAHIMSGVAPTLKPANLAQTLATSFNKKAPKAKNPLTPVK